MSYKDTMNNMGWSMQVQLTVLISVYCLPAAPASASQPLTVTGLIMCFKKSGVEK